MASETARTPGQVAWPDKMITQAEAMAKAGHWPIWVDTLAKGTAYLRCGYADCDQSCGQLMRDGVKYNASLDEMLSMVLRHMVMAHDVPLNTREAFGANPGDNLAIHEEASADGT